MATITTLSKLAPAAAGAFGNAVTASVTIPMIIMATSKGVLNARTLLQSQTRTRGVAGADLVIRFLFSFSTLLHDLGRDRYGPSRTACSHCRRRTRLFSCERVLRQETSIVHISSIGTIELSRKGPSSCAQLPMHTCVDCSKDSLSLPKFQIACANNSMSCNPSSVRVGEKFQG